MIEWLLLVEYTREAVTPAYICYRVIIPISEMNYFLLKWYYSSFIEFNQIIKNIIMSTELISNLIRLKFNSGWTLNHGLFFFDKFIEFVCV